MVICACALNNSLTIIKRIRSKLHHQAQALVIDDQVLASRSFSPRS
jgi:hypothetical protein